MLVNKETNLIKLGSSTASNDELNSNNRLCLKTNKIVHNLSTVHYKYGITHRNMRRNNQQCTKNLQRLTTNRQHCWWIFFYRSNIFVSLYESHCFCTVFLCGNCWQQLMDDWCQKALITINTTFISVSVWVDCWRWNI